VADTVRLVTFRVLHFFVRRVVVNGDSMVPALVDGQRVTALRRWRPLRVGDVVLVRDPREPGRWLVKRCIGLDASGVDLRGDNAAHSTDSRVFGSVPRRDVRWFVVNSPH
jgi:nickel-type superoxide dismutase maturation protease